VSPLQYATLDRGKTDWGAIYYELVRLGCSPRDIPDMTYDQVNMLIEELSKHREKENANIQMLAGRKAQIKHVIVLNQS
jgi:hypothetical protein